MFFLCTVFTGIIKLCLCFVVTLAYLNMAHADGDTLSSGIEKFFTVSPNVRLEHPKSGETGRHLFEFSQVDFEIAHADMNNVFDLIQETVTKIIQQVRKDCSEELDLWDRELKIPKKFEVYSTDQLIERYGTDWGKLVSEEAVDPFGC